MRRRNCSRIYSGVKKLSMHCDFGNFLNDGQRDCLVCGVYKEVTQKRMLIEVELTFKKACEIAQAMGWLTSIPAN